MPDKKPNPNFTPPKKTPRPDAGPIVALFSGGLDSMLAIRTMQRQGFEIEAFCVLVPYGLDRHDVAKAARRIGVRLTAISGGTRLLGTPPQSRVRITARRPIRVSIAGST